MSNQTSENVDIKALEEAKRLAQEKLHQLEKELSKAKENAMYSSSIPQEEQDDNAEEDVEISESAQSKPSDSLKDAKKKDKEQERLAKLKKSREKEKEQLELYAKSVANRTKGKIKAEPGNLKVRYTNSEVFIFIVDDNELQLKVMQEQFKNSRSFKNTKGFTSGETLLKYLKTRKFPKKSIILVVMDYFLENSDDEDAQNGIAVLAQIKEYDPDIEVIMLSSHADVDIAASAAHFGAITFIQKGNDAMKKVFNNIVWTIREKDQIQKKADTKAFIKSAIIIFFVIIIGLVGIDVVLKGKLGIAWWAKAAPAIEQAAPVVPPTTETPPTAPKTE